MGNEGLKSETDSSSESSMETDSSEERGLLGTEKDEEIKERPYIHGPSDNEEETVERLTIYTLYMDRRNNKAKYVIVILQC